MQLSRQVFRFLTVSFLLLPVLANPMAARSSELTLFSRGNWTVILSASQVGEDMACIASGFFPAGFFSIVVFPDQVMVSIYDQSLKIVGSVEGSVIVRVSGNGISHSEHLRIQSYGQASQQVVVSRDVNEYLLDAIMRGLTMELVYPDNTKWDVSLSGSYASLLALIDCADRYLGPPAPVQSPNPWR